MPENILKYMCEKIFSSGSTVQYLTIRQVFVPDYRDAASTASPRPVLRLDLVQSNCFCNAESHFVVSNFICKKFSQTYMWENIFPDNSTMNWTQTLYLSIEMHLTREKTVNSAGLLHHGKYKLMYLSSEIIALRSLLYCGPRNFSCVPQLF